MNISNENVSSSDKSLVIEESDNTSRKHTHLSEEETKLYITPFAFSVNETLFGIPLASPFKRALALCIDLILIAMLSEAPAGILAFAIAITLFQLGSKSRAVASGKTRGYKRRAISRGIGSIIIFVLLINVFSYVINATGLDSDDSSHKSTVQLEGRSLTLEESIVLTTYATASIVKISQSTCKELSCWQEELITIVDDMAEVLIELNVEINEQEIVELFTQLTESTSLATNEQEQLQQSLVAHLNKLLLDKKEQAKADLSAEKVADSLENEEVLLAQKALPSSDIKQNEVDNAIKEPLTVNKKPVYSIIEWVKGIINDLGLGFGWATFYFTVFIALANGQTLGKKIFGIKVLQLDGTPLSLWDSFGRYGGYGAGLATGLLGFLQIYWDPNRQAIHDKISATVVIDTRKGKLTSQ